MWNRTSGGHIDSSPAVVNGRVYIGSDDNKVYCLGANTGSILWNYTTGGIVASSPAVADGKVYVGSHEQKIYCLDAVSGAHVWDCKIGNLLSEGYGFTSSPAVADGKVYVGSEENGLYCLDATTGSQLWNYSAGGWMDSSPTVADGLVFIGSGDSHVYAFGNVIRVPEDYSTVQAAINAAAPGATVWIAPGVYNESLVINKKITLIGEPGSEPKFDCGGSGIAITILSGGSGSTIAGITITSWDGGISLQDANNCRIYDNIMSLITNNGITLQGTGATKNQIYSNIFKNDAVALDVTSSSSNNVISQNIISLSGVGLKIETGGNIVCENIISDNQLGLALVNSNNNVIYHNDFLGNTNSFTLSSSTSPGNTWDNGYPSGGNYWSTYSSADLLSGPYQNETHSNGLGDGIYDTPYAIAVNNKDRYPLTKPFFEHSIGIASFIVAKTVVCRGYGCDMTVSVLNYGMYDETFNVTAWANQAKISLETFALTSRSSSRTTFTWNTAGIAYGNYTVASVADMVPGETSQADHAVPGGWIIVTLPGDITSPNGWPDGLVDMTDIGFVASHFLGEPSKPLWNPNADINNDYIIDMADIGIAASHFLDHYP
jgi:parallel beta-helix repeat protein